MPKILIDKIELENVRKTLDCLLEKGTNQPFSKFAEQRTAYANTHELNKKERLVLDYLKMNPGITKEDVVRGLEDKYSRIPVRDAIDRLLKIQLVITARRNKKSRINYLYVNYEEAVLSMQENLGIFQYFYSELIDAMIPIFLRLSENEKGKERMISKAIDLLYKIVEIYRFLCIMYITSDIFLWQKRPLDNDILHTKFGLFFDTMKEIHSELLEMLTRIGIGLEKGQEMLCTILCYTGLGFSLTELFSMLRYFKKYGLSDYLEPVIDALWALSYPILPMIDPSYKRSYENGTLKDWRNLIKAKYASQYQPTTEQWLAPEGQTIMFNITNQPTLG